MARAKEAPAEEPEAEEEIVVVEVDDDDHEETSEKEEGTEESDAEHPEGDDDDDEDESEEEKERAREKNRRGSAKERRAKQKQKAAEKEEAYKRELLNMQRQMSEMSKQLAAQNNRGIQQDIAQVDEAIQRAVQEVNYAKHIMNEAIATGNGAKATEAQDRWYRATRAAEQLQTLKQQASQRARTPPAQGIDPVMKRHYESWRARNSWYSDAHGDEDSKIAFVIDGQLAQEGYDPKSSEYWEELEHRCQKRLPHLFKQEQRERARPKAIVSGSGGNGAPRPQQIRLTASQVQAIKDAGMWDDIPQRNRMIKRYAEQSRNKGNS